MAKNIFIFSTARSGTTWLAEILATQGRFKIVNEPFNLRVPVVSDTLGMSAWNELFDPDNRAKIRSYIESFIVGKDTDLRFKRETPFSRHWHYRTDRVIFKILFAGESSVSWFRDQFDSHVILLLRHPLAVSRSRKQFPRLQSFLESDYALNFSSEQMDYAHSVIDSGDELQIAVLDWCLQNAVPLRDVESDWLVLSYEQLVLEPDVVVRHLVKRLSLTSEPRMMRQVFTASGSTGHSSAESRSLLLDPEAIRQNRSHLVSAWREWISDVTESRAFETLRKFEIDYYCAGRDVPVDKYWIREA